MRKGRILTLSIFVLLGAILFFVKLYLLQIVHSNEYSDRADRQYQQPSSATLDRGTIFFSPLGGDVLGAATLKTGVILAVNPKNMQKASTSPDVVYQKINALLPLDKADFIAHVTKPNDSYEEIAKRVDPEIGTAIAKLKIPGVILTEDKWRYYPGGTLAAHVLGFMGYKENEYAGRYGLERFYEKVLNYAGNSLYSNFFAEIFSNINKTVVKGEQLEGDIVTSIEPTTQAYLESTLKKVNQKYSSESTGGIIMDPKTGEIYAMGLYPTYDPNDLKAEKSVDVFQNDLVEGVREMGSIIKPLTMAVGIDTGKVSASTTYNDLGSVTVNNRTIYNFDKKGRGVITLQVAMAQSLNTGFVYVERLIGNAVFADYFKKLGLGEKTGIDLPNEGSGIISNLNSPRDIEYATASFGQGLAMTPIETIRALGVLANGGKLVTPHVVKRINYRLGYSKDVTPPVGPQVIKPTTAEDVTRMLVDDVDKVLLAGKAKNPHYSVAAKTGTAQIAQAGGGYYEDKNLHSFIGYLPAYDPKFIVFLYTVNPRGVRYSSESLAQPFIDMTKFLISYYKIAPDR